MVYSKKKPGLSLTYNKPKGKYVNPQTWNNHSLCLAFFLWKKIGRLIIYNQLTYFTPF